MAKLLFFVFLFISSNFLTVSRSAPVREVIDLDLDEPAEAADHFLTTEITFTETPIVELENTSKPNTNETQAWQIEDLLSGTISLPWKILAFKLNAIASVLPPLFGVGGYAVGALVATPIRISSSVASGVGSGISGLLVSVPIAVGSSVASAISEAKKLMEDYERTSGNASDIPPELLSESSNHSIIISTPVIAKIHHPDPDDHPTLLMNATIPHPIIDEHERSVADAAENLILTPLAVLVGTNSALLGASSVKLGDGVRFVGTGIATAGDDLRSFGKGIQGVGSYLFSWGAGFPIPVVNTGNDAQTLWAICHLPSPFRELVLGDIAKLFCISDDDSSTPLVGEDSTSSTVDDLDFM